MIHKYIFQISLASNDVTANQEVENLEVMLKYEHKKVIQLVSFIKNLS